MLVLTRKDGEVILITPPGGPPIKVAIIDIRGDKVRIGIDAPRSVLVDRAEVSKERERRAREGGA